MDSKHDETKDFDADPWLEFFDVVFVFVYAFVFVLDKIAHDGTATQGEGWSGVALGGACQSQHLMDLLLCTDRTLQ